jgi:hypothetical protein
LVIVRGPHAVQRIFAMTSHDEQFELVGDPSEAMATA